MIGPEDAELVGEEFGEGARWIPGMAAAVGEVAADAQGVGAVSAEDTFAVAEEFGEAGRCARWIPGMAAPEGEVAAGEQGVGVVSAGSGSTSVELGCRLPTSASDQVADGGFSWLADAIRRATVPHHRT